MQDKVKFVMSPFVSTSLHKEGLPAIPIVYQGLFVRKMLLFNKMSFGQVLHLTALLKHYIMDSTTYSTGDEDNEMEKRSP